MFDGVNIRKQVNDTQRAQHRVRVMHRGIGKHELASRQSRQRRAQHGLGHQHVVQIGKLMRVPQKMRGVGVVMTDQTEYGRAVAPPVGLAQRIGVRLAQVQMRLHILRHGAVDARKDMRGGVVQRVVEIEYPCVTLSRDLWSHAQRLLINVPTPSLVRISSNSACSTRPSMM